MNIINDLPFYIVIIAVFVNVLIGIFTRVDFTVLMIRSIVVTVVFSVFGLIVSEILKKVAVSDINREKNKNGTADILGGASGSTIDIQVPPMDENELLSYREEDSGSNEDFLEVNPAYLHKFSQEEQNE